jgi:hypothetical protein
MDNPSPAAIYPDLLRPVIRMASIALIYKHPLNNDSANYISHLLELSAQSMIVVGVARETPGSYTSVPLAADGNTDRTATLVFLTDFYLRNTFHQRVMHPVNLPSIASFLLMDELSQNQNLGGGSVCFERLPLNLWNHSAELGSQIAENPFLPIHLTRMRVAALHHL